MKSKGSDRTVSVAKLKAELSRYLRAIRSGSSLVVTDHERPVARLIPFVESKRFHLPRRAATRSVKDLQELVIPPLEKRVDSVSFLIEDRRAER
jgi:prevent-host-death family protein